MMSLLIISGCGVNYEQVIGKWERPDGGYVLEITGIKDNQVYARYFNPRQINIAKSEIRDSSDGKIIYIEFDDENYKGSFYKLMYVEKNNLLMGKYYAAPADQTYNIYFQRIH
ncbi:MAG: hypothetical protein JW969_08935 [Spirochaetales bacterium]|nr:hypothetical protein [Spirochaetales bacterium]